MGKRTINIFLGSFIVALFIAACGRKNLPANSSPAELKNYDVAQYEYLYVEALKQKLLGNGGDALKYLEQCIRINPGSDAANYQMAQIIAASGDIKNARKYAVRAFDIDNKNLWYLMLISQLYYQEKNIDSAIVWYEKAVELFPDNENIQLTLGNLYIEDSEFEKANFIFDNFDRKYGVNEASTLSSVRSLIASGKFADAKVKAESLLKQEPGNILYNGLLAEIYRSLGDKEGAAGIYRAMTESNPGNPQVQLSLADFLMEEKMYDELFNLLNSIVLNNSIRKEEKVQFFARLLENPDILKDQQNRLIISLMVLEAGNKDDNIVPLLRPDLLVRQGKTGEAAARLEEIIAQQPGNYLAWEKLLLTYLELKDYEKLTKRGEECATRFNMSFLAKVLYAQGAIETGKTDIAIAELGKAEILAGDNKDFMVQVLTMRADVYYRMKDFDRAFQTFEEALKYNKDDLTVLNNYAYYLAEQDTKLKEAEELAKRVVEIEKGNTTFLDTYGWVLYKRGKVGEAAKVFETIIGSGETPDAEWFEHYGYILKRQNKCEKAVENWKISIQLDPTKTHLLNEIENCGK